MSGDDATKLWSMHDLTWKIYHVFIISPECRILAESFSQKDNRFPLKSEKQSSRLFAKNWKLHYFGETLHRSAVLLNYIKYIWWYYGCVIISLFFNNKPRSRRKKANLSAVCRIGEKIALYVEYRKISNDNRLLDNDKKEYKRRRWEKKNHLSFQLSWPRIIDREFFVKDALKWTLDWKTKFFPSMYVFSSFFNSLSQPAKI